MFTASRVISVRLVQVPGDVGGPGEVLDVSNVLHWVDGRRGKKKKGSAFHGSVG